jgi:uncharacterized protein
MASKDFFAAVETRLSCYALTNASPISDSHIHEIINTTVKHAPSTFNVQSARAVVLLKSEHGKLWDMADACLKQAVPEQAYNSLKGRVKGFREAYGTVMWFEDQDALGKLGQSSPSMGAIKHLFPDCKRAFPSLDAILTSSNRVQPVEWNASVHRLDSV